MPTEQEVYSQHADLYDRLIQREDYQGNLLKAIESIIAPDDLDIIDLGSGTGRLARLLASRARSLRAFDASDAMLAVAAESLRGMGVTNWQAQAADHRRLPVPEASADLVVSGWSFSYLSVWGDHSQLEAGWGEVERVLRPGGTVILIESLGTGNLAPIRLPHLDAYYAWLDEKGFARREISTDYRFASLSEARELAGFFFGQALAAGIEAEILSEFSGVWWKKL